MRLARAAVPVLILVLAAALAPAPALAATPLATPTDLKALYVADTNAELDWRSDGLADQEVVERNVGGVWREYARTQSSVTTLALTPALTCRTQVISYGTGRTFAANVTLVNTTATATAGWTIRFMLPATMAASNPFNGALTRDGDTGTLTPLAYSARIGPGGQITVGFSGGGVAAVPPTGFTVDGLPCPAG